MARVIVTDGRARQALAIIRSLGKKSIEVTPAEEFACSSFYSKYASSRLIYPSPGINPDMFMQKILGVLKKDRYAVIIPVREEATLLLSKYKDKLSHLIKIPVADHNILMTAHNKAQTLKIAAEIGIPCPQTYFIEDSIDINRIINKLDFPVIVKPHKSSGSMGVKYVQSSEELLSTYNYVRNQYGLCFIQEFIPHGGGYGVSMLFNQGEPRAIFTHKRLREHPSSGGPSTLRESIRFPEIERYASTLLKSLEWHGVAMVEFRVDARDGKPKLMEINPRFWGSLALAIFSGIDFPYLLYKMAIEGDVKPMFKYKTGMKMRWFLFGDVLWFLNASDKLKALPEFLKFRDKNMGYDILSLDDPLPSIGIILESIKSLVSKERRNYAFRRGWKNE